MQNFQLFFRVFMRYCFLILMLMAVCAITFSESFSASAHPLYQTLGMYMRFYGFIAAFLFSIAANVVIQRHYRRRDALVTIIEDNGGQKYVDTMLGRYALKLARNGADIGETDQKIKPILKFLRNIGLNVRSSGLHSYLPRA